MNLIKAKNLQKSYKSKLVLKGVNLEVNKGEIVGYIGPNGSGKTTTIKILCGILKASRGTVQLYNGSNNLSSMNIGVVLDGLGLYKRLTVWENLEFVTRLIGLSKKETIESITNMLLKVELYDERNQLVKHLSKGMSRRLAIAKSMIHNPNILILDEPFDGVDTKSHYDMIQLLKDWVSEGERCIFFTSHNMADVQILCQKVIIINNGNIIVETEMSELIKMQNELCFNLAFKENIDFLRISNAISDYSLVSKLNENEISIKVKSHRAISDFIVALEGLGYEITKFSQSILDFESFYLKKLEEDCEVK